MKTHQLKFRRLEGRFAVCRLSADAAIPAWAMSASFASITRTGDERSVVCPQENVPSEVQAERNWVGFKLQGPFPFSQTGILASFLTPLAEGGIPIFALSTYDTDYVFVKQESAEAALHALQSAGHELVND